MNNLDLFNCASLEILHRSLDSFPIPIKVVPSEIASNVLDYFEVTDDPESQLKEVALTCQHTIFWLSDERFIDIKQKFIDGSSYISLTQKGLNALNSVPASLDDTKKPFREYFMDGLIKLPFGVATAVMSEFFKTGS